MTTPPGSVATRPAAVSNAVRLMYVIAALDVLEVAVGLSRPSVVREQARAQFPELSASQLSNVVAAIIAVSIGLGLLFAALWVVFAVFTGRGRNWARIVATVLAALTVLSGVSSLRDGISLPDVVTLVAAVLAVVVVALMFQDRSSRFFASGGLRRGRDDDPGEPGYPGYPPVQQP